MYKKDMTLGHLAPWWDDGHHPQHFFAIAMLWMMTIIPSTGNMS